MVFCPWFCVSFPQSKMSLKNIYAYDFSHRCGVQDILSGIYCHKSWNKVISFKLVWRPHTAFLCNSYVGYCKEESPPSFPSVNSNWSNWEEVLFSLSYMHIYTSICQCNYAVISTYTYLYWYLYWYVFIYVFINIKIYLYISK